MTRSPADAMRVDVGRASRGLPRFALCSVLCDKKSFWSRCTMARRLDVTVGLDRLNILVERLTNSDFF